MPLPTLPVILDCDPGTDDALAILLALASPEIDLRAITVTGGNVGLDSTLANALGLVELARGSTGSGPRVPPIHAGADRSLLRAFESETRVHGLNGLGGIVLPAGAMRPEPELASDAIRRMLRTAAPAPTTLVGIGPATNLGLALATEPQLARNVAEIVLMTGAWGEGNITPSAEFNAFNDPEALAILLASGRPSQATPPGEPAEPSPAAPVTLVTLDLTVQALVTPPRIDALRRAGQGRCLQVACDILASIPPSVRVGGAGTPLHDPCAIAWLIRPDLFTSRPCAASVDLGPGPCRGRTVIDRWKTPSARCNARALETLDGDGFFALLAERLARLP